jgi:hypothetical protein
MALSIGTRHNVHVDEQHVSLLAEHMGIAKSVSSKGTRTYCHVQKTGSYYNFKPES